jgi:predicted amino acid-binding ACT domain protein
VFTDKVGTYIDIIGGQFINEDVSENQQYFNDKIKIVNGIKEFVTDILSFEIEETEISQQMPDNLFNLMCTSDYVKNQSLFNTFFHDNRYVKNSIKKIERK